jgi:NADPH-dependent glutamate synthase beta subunit-like oxidoreductase
VRCGVQDASSQLCRVGELCEHRLLTVFCTYAIKSVNVQNPFQIMAPIKKVAVIGAGPAGAIAVDALAQEEAFDIIRVFERREKAGGCW